MGKIIYIAATILMMSSLVSCETSKGVGEDMQNAGEAIQETATEVQRDM